MELVSIELDGLSLSSVKSAYENGFISENTALSFYQEWVCKNTWIVISTANRQYPINLPNVYKQSFVPIFHFFKASKRGNDVYLRKVRNRFFNLRSSCLDNNKVRLLDGHGGVSNILFITLTYDTNRCNKKTAFVNVGYELNNFLSCLKSKYGKIKVLRCFEVYPNGYPHIHLIIEFLDCKFRFVRHIFKNGKYGYIIRNNVQRKEIEGYWHSFANIRGVESFGGVNYLLKYITKEMYNDNYRTVAHLWLYHKQSYSMSKGFLENKFKELDYQVHTVKTNSNLCLSNGVYLGCFDTDFRPEINYFVVKKPPNDINWEVPNDYLPKLFRMNFKAFYENRIELKNRF